MRTALRPNGAPPRRERTACGCLAVAIARSKDPSACIISDETFSKAEPYGIMLRRDDAPFKAMADRASADLYRSPEIEAIYRGTGIAVLARTGPMTRSAHIALGQEYDRGPTARGHAPSRRRDEAFGIRG